MSDKIYYVFSVTNVEKDSCDIHKNGYAIYHKKDDVLHCEDEEISRYQRISINSRESLATILLGNNIREIFTKEPRQDEVCSYPYEVEEEADFKKCEDDGDWYVLPHSKL